jgi:hypothetical protein
VLGEYAGSGSLKGKPVIIRDTRGIVPDLVRALNAGIERGYRSENGLNIRMAMKWPLDLRERAILVVDT